MIIYDGKISGVVVRVTIQRSPKEEHVGFFPLSSLYPHISKPEAYSPQLLLVVELLFLALVWVNTAAILSKRALV